VNEMVGHTECCTSGTRSTLEDQGRGSVGGSLPAPMPTVWAAMLYAQKPQGGRRVDDTTIIPCVGQPWNRAAGSRRLSLCATPSARWARVWAARSPVLWQRGSAEDTISNPLPGLGRAELHGFVPRELPLFWKATPTTIWARACQAESSFCARRSMPACAGQNVIAGNVPLYGATSGELHSRPGGRAFLRAQQRRERGGGGVGDHGCEYMRCRVIVLGPTGRNSRPACRAALPMCWMSSANWNPIAIWNGWAGSLDDPQETELVLSLIRRHAEFTGSLRAQDLLAHWAQWNRWLCGSPR